MTKLETVLVIGLLVGSLAAPPARADIRIGVKAGGNVARPTGLQAWDPSATTLKSKSGFTGGVFLAMNCGRYVTVQWEALYTMKGAVYTSPDASVTETLTADYLEVPLLLMPVWRRLSSGSRTSGYCIGFRMK